MSNSVYSKCMLSRHLSESRIKISAVQLNLLLLSQVSICRNFGFGEVAFQSLIYIFKKCKLFSFLTIYRISTKERAAK
jgi:hypothetical protein